MNLSTGPMRSKLEAKVAAQLPEYEYERECYVWYERKARALCRKCGSTEIYQ
ncbi:hypothetical protein LCGC14_2746380, partial [marine sediment metagenome]